MGRSPSGRFGTLLPWTACAPDASETPEARGAPPEADVQVTAVREDAFVSPYTNTPYGGSHVRQYQGRPSGTITTHGEVAVLELDEGVVSEANLFDLDGRTLRFRPEGPGFRAENLPLEWVTDRGEPLEGRELDLGFPFPFSGTTWTSLVVDDKDPASMDPVLGEGHRWGGDDEHEPGRLRLGLRDDHPRARRLVLSSNHLYLR